MASAWNEDRGLDSCLGPAQGRREFLKQAGILPAALLACDGATGAEGGSAPASLPQIRLGTYSISRLICGANPFNAGSHLSVFVNRQMRAYYTPEQILKTLRRCQEVGINCWQSGLANIELYRRTSRRGRPDALSGHRCGRPGIHRRFGSRAAASASPTTARPPISSSRAASWTMHDYLKRVRDAGLLVGVSTHMPAVVDAIESKGWDIDYYMTCVYERHRSKEELERLLGQVPFPVGEVYLPIDPPRMFQAIGQTKRPCLAFKILAAGRLSERRNGSSKPSARPSSQSSPRTESSSASTTTIPINRPKMPTSPGDLE